MVFTNSVGVPERPYLEQASAQRLAAFELQLELIKQVGYTVRMVKTLEEIETINKQHSRLVFAEMAQVHSEWFTHFESLYRPRTASAIREEHEVSAHELSVLRASPTKLRAELQALMARVRQMKLFSSGQLRWLTLYKIKITLCIQTDS